MSSDEREAELQAMTTGLLERLDGSVVLHDYDPRWREQFSNEAEGIQAALAGACSARAR